MYYCFVHWTQLVKLGDDGISVLRGRGLSTQVTSDGLSFSDGLEEMGSESETATV